MARYDFLREVKSDSNTICEIDIDPFVPQGSLVMANHAQQIADIYLCTSSCLDV